MLDNHLKQSQSSPRGYTRPGLTMQASLRDREQHILPPPRFPASLAQEREEGLLATPDLQVLRP